VSINKQHEEQYVTFSRLAQRWLLSLLGPQLPLSTDKWSTY